MSQISSLILRISSSFDLFASYHLYKGYNHGLNYIFTHFESKTLYDQIYWPTMKKHNLFIHYLEWLLLLLIFTKMFNKFGTQTPWEFSIWWSLDDTLELWDLCCGGMHDALVKYKVLLSRGLIPINRPRDTLLSWKNDTVDCKRQKHSYTVYQIIRTESKNTSNKMWIPPCLSWMMKMKKNLNMDHEKCLVLLHPQHLQH